MSDLHVKTLNEDISVAGLLTPEQMADVKAAGFASVIINIPDGESGSDQASSVEVLAQAEALGLKGAYLPIPKGMPTQDHAREFGALFKSLPQPILAFCRSGMRSEAVYSIASQYRYL